MLGHEHQGHHAAVVQIGEQLVELDDERALLRHGGEQPVQAVDDHHARVIALHAPAHALDELAGRELRGVDLLERDAPAFQVRPQGEAERIRANEGRAVLLIEEVDHRVLSAGGGAGRVLGGHDGFSGPRRAHQQGARPPDQASAQEGVELGHAALDDSTVAGPAMLRRNHPGEYPHPAGDDPEVVVPASKVETAELGDPQPSPLGAERGGELLEPDDTMRDAVQLEIVGLRGPVIEEQHGAPPPDEELLQGQDLPAVAQRVSREQTNLGQGVEHHPHGVGPLHLTEHRARGLAELHLGGMEDGVLVVRVRRFGGRGQLVEGDVVERPAVRLGHRAKLVGAFRERHVQAGLTETGALEQELQRERRLPGPGLSFDEIESILRESAAQDIVQALDAGGDGGWPGGGILRHGVRGWSRL